MAVATGGLVRRLLAPGRGVPVLSTTLLLAGAIAASACDTRDLADAVSFNSCGIPWEWARSQGGEAVYLCDNPACDDGTILQLSVEEMQPDDAAMSTAELLQDWLLRTVPAQMGDYSIEMLGEISVATIGGHEGVYIPMRLTDKSGEAYTSLGFRVPLGNSYVIANATGDIDQTVLRGFLSLAVENLDIQE